MIFSDCVEDIQPIKKTYAQRAAHGQRDTSTDAPRRFSDFERQHFIPENITPDRPCTAFCKAENYLTANKVFDALAKENFPATSIRCLQRRPTGEILVTFCMPARRNSFLKHSSFIVRNTRVLPNDHDSPLKFLTVYDAPYELSDAAT